MLDRRGAEVHGSLKRIDDQLSTSRCLTAGERKQRLKEIFDYWNQTFKTC